MPGAMTKAGYRRWGIGTWSAVTREHQNSAAGKAIAVAGEPGQTRAAAPDRGQQITGAG